MNSKLRARSVGKLTWKRVLRSLFLIPLCVAFGLISIAILFADRVIFQPPNPSYRDTAQIIKLTTATGETISAKFYSNDNAHHTILFSHGNAEDLGTIEPFVTMLRDTGFNVLAFDYAGYGTSTGSPSETNSYADIDAAYKYLRIEKAIPADKILVHGRSLGGGVAVDLASREKVGGLILESTFMSAFRVMTHYPILPFDKFKSIEKLDRVECPTLVIHGTKDKITPTYYGERLFEEAKAPKYHYWVEAAGHNNVLDRNKAEYLNSIVRFVDSLETPPV